MLTKVKRCFQQDAVLAISFFLAVISCFFNPPSLDYLGYLDFHTLILLFCLMVIVAGLKECGVFRSLGTGILSMVHSERMIALILIFLCFFCSMLITNDVSLITFIPFCILLLQMCHLEYRMTLLVTLMTIAANLGSMFTPIGNPQNLYLYSLSGLSLPQFLQLMLPVTSGAAVLLLFCIFCFFSGRKIPVVLKPEPLSHPRRIPAFVLLFFCCLCTVAGILPHAVLLLVTVAGIFFLDRSLYRKADYSLLFTFVFFFLFIGNMKQIDSLRILLERMITGRERLIAVLTSQIISNVPAAMLLSGYTKKIPDLIIGTNLGGLGTLIASMASLISYRQITAFDSSCRKKYLAVFTIFNLVFLAILYQIR